MTLRASLFTLVVVGLALSRVIGQQKSSGDTRQTPVAGRSKIATKYGIVAASQPLAARAGVQVLERGGNAVDAAIATNAVMGLVEPHNNGIGGDLFVIYYEAKTGKLYGLNSERLALAQPGAVVMHPGPMNEGVEISSDVAHGDQSVIEEQVTNGVAVRMALLYLLSGGTARPDGE